MIADRVALGHVAHAVTTLALASSTETTAETVLDRAATILVRGSLTATTADPAATILARAVSTAITY
ncbi:MAG: hypothetical protein ACKO92_00170, partial [Actinomycetota bacterium]